VSASPGMAACRHSVLLLSPLLERNQFFKNLVQEPNKCIMIQSYWPILCTLVNKSLSDASLAPKTQGLWGGQLPSKNFKSYSRRGV
jgi:hypothetical protein